MPTPARDPAPGLAAIAASLRAAGCVFAEEEARLLAESARTPQELRAMIARRAAGLPLEHVVGWAGFCELRIAVGPGVFVPRRRSELLARQAAALTPPGSIVVDLACGSGALGVAIAALAADIELHACDIDPVAVACARRNVEPAGGHVYAGDLYEPLPAALRGRVATIAANVPYVPTEQLALMPAEARDHEPLARPRRRRRRARPAPPGSCGRRRLAAARRSRADRDQHGPGRCGIGRVRRGRPGADEHQRRGPGRHDRHRPGLPVAR